MPPNSCCFPYKRHFKFTVYEETGLGKTLLRKPGVLVGDTENLWPAKALTEWNVVPGTLYYNFTSGLFCSLTTGECAGESSNAF